MLRSREAIKNADIVLFISDVEQDIPIELQREVESIIDKNKVIYVLNKIDLKPGANKISDVSISAKTGQGMENLFTKLRESVFHKSSYSEKSAIVSNLRHFQCLKKAKEHLENAKNSILNKLSGEYISVDLRSAEISLSEIIGEVTSDDILNNIFMKFCIGK